MRLKSSKIVESRKWQKWPKKKIRSHLWTFPPEKILISGCHLDLKMGLFQSNKYQVLDGSKWHLMIAFLDFSLRTKAKKIRGSSSCWFYHSGLKLVLYGFIYLGLFFLWKHLFPQFSTKTVRARLCIKILTICAYH